MNVLGTIGTLMDGTRLNEIMETVYGENTVVHMMSGKAVQRAFLGHLLVDQCLTRQIVAKIMEDEPGFQDQAEELEQLYMLMETGKCDLDSLLESDCIDRIHNSLIEKKDELARNSKTSKLWINYQQILSIARASQCCHSLPANIRSRWPSELFTVGSSISPEDVFLERQQS